MANLLSRGRRGGALTAPDSAAPRGVPVIRQAKALNTAAVSADIHQAACHPDAGSASASAPEDAMPTPTPPNPHPGRWGEWSARLSIIEFTAMTNTTALVNPAIVRSTVQPIALL